jgi:hypothetical protein
VWCRITARGSGFRVQGSGFRIANLGFRSSDYPAAGAERRATLASGT